MVHVALFVSVVYIVMTYRFKVQTGGSGCSRCVTPFENRMKRVFVV